MYNYNIYIYIYIYAIVAILFLNRKEKLLGREPLQSSKLLLLTHSEPPYHLYRWFPAPCTPPPPICPIYTWSPSWKLVPNCSAPWFLQWQHVIHSLPPTTQKLEFNHLKFNHLINIDCSRYPRLPSALSKMPAWGNVHRLFLRVHAVIVFHILSLLKSFYPAHTPGRKKRRKKEEKKKKDYEEMAL